MSDLLAPAVHSDAHRRWGWGGAPVYERGRREGAEWGCGRRDVLLPPRAPVAVVCHEDEPARRDVLRKTRVGEAAAACQWWCSLRHMGERDFRVLFPSLLTSLPTVNSLGGNSAIFSLRSCAAEAMAQQVGRAVRA